MGKILLTGIGVLGFCFCLSAASLAATAGNTASVDSLNGPGTFSLKKERDLSVETAVDIDIVLSRDIAGGEAAGIKLENSQWYMVRLGYRFFDRFEPYVRLGGAHMKAKWNDQASGAAVAMDTSSGTAWGVGFKGLIFEAKRPVIKITGDVSYRKTDLYPYKGHLNTNVVHIDRTASKFVISEWQVSLLAATEVDLGVATDRSWPLNGYKLSPYAGLKWSELSGRLRLVDSSTGTTYHPDDISSEKNFGLIIGGDVIWPNDSFSLNLEGRFLDESAISTGVSLLF